MQKFRRNLFRQQQNCYIILHIQAWNKTQKDQFLQQSIDSLSLGVDWLWQSVDNQPR